MPVRPALLLAAAAAVAVLAVAVCAAPAGAARIAPPGTGADRVALAAASGGRAVLAWNAHGAAGDAVQIAQLAPGTGFAGGQTALQAPTVLAPAAAALDPSGGAQVLAATGVRANLPNQFVAARRAAATGAFGTPAPVGTGSFVQIVSAAANARGDLAAVVSSGPRHAVLVTAPAGGAFGAPQDINPGGLADTAAVGLGPDGALVVASYDGVSRVLVRRGAVGGALGASQALAQVLNRPDFSAAIDDDGTATVAFGRSLGRDGIGVAVARARTGAAFGVPVTLDRGPNAQVPQVAAGGSTTAVTWLSLTAGERVRVAIARDAGRFGRPQTPATGTFELRGEAGRVPSEAGVPTVAVDRAGDVLLAYPYGCSTRSTRRCCGPGATASSLRGSCPRSATGASRPRRSPTTGARSSRGPTATACSPRRARPPRLHPRARRDAVAPQRRGAAPHRRGDRHRALRPALRDRGERAADHRPRRPGARHLAPGAPAAGDRRQRAAPPAVRAHARGPRGAAGDGPRAGQGHRHRRERERRGAARTARQAFDVGRPSR